MKIVHLCLSCFFIDGRGYQENELVRQHVREGHDVLVIASTETHSPDGALMYVKPAEYVGEEGARVIRLAYFPGIPHGLVRKLRIHAGVYDLLAQFKPDTILFHGACGWELRTVARFVRDYPSVMFYVDSHEDWNNSARGAISREFLHKLYYRAVLQSSLPSVKKILCVSTETMQFVKEIYGIPQERLEFYPLGGRPVPDDEYAERRSRTRMALGLRQLDIVFVQSGKQTRRKKLLESLRAFIAVDDRRFRFLVVGVLDEEIRGEAEKLMAGDARIRYVGWKTQEELTDILCAADVYVQPGTQSATMQHSLCARCAVVLDDVPAHEVYHRGNGWLINNERPLEAALIEAQGADLELLQANSYRIACEMLDYSILSRRVLS